MNCSGVKVYSHPRSGTHFLLSLLGQAFFGNAKPVMAITGHWSRRAEVMVLDTGVPFGGHLPYRDGLPGSYIYLYRDGRDVALSLWRTKAFQHKSWARLSFSEFLRRPLDWRHTPARRFKSTLTIVEHWKALLESWQDAPDVCFVSYEHLLLHTKSEMGRIAAFVARAPLPAADGVPGVGPFPSGDYRVSKWKTVFSDDDLDYFFEIVPRDFWGLWEEQE